MSQFLKFWIILIFSFNFPSRYILSWFPPIQEHCHDLPNHASQYCKGNHRHHIFCSFSFFLIWKIWNIWKINVWTGFPCGQTLSWHDLLKGKTSTDARSTQSQFVLKMFSISQNKGRNRAARAVKKWTKVTFLKQSIILNNVDHQDEGPFPAGQSTMDRLLLVVQCVIGGGKVKLHHHNDHYHNWPPYHKIHCGSIQHNVLLYSLWMHYIQTFTALGRHHIGRQLGSY